MQLDDVPNLNRCWADLIVEEAVRCGVTQFYLAPGSRSTPLTTAVAAHAEAQSTMHYDERGTAFMALGYGRVTGRPAAWITTSGTAVANGMPAVVEASVDRVPMLLLTADRPPELRDTGGNQTIDQVKLFGNYVRWFADLPTPTDRIAPAYVLTTVDQAVYRAQRLPAGPVHLNCMFRKPLGPEPDGHDWSEYVSQVAAWSHRSTPFTVYPKPSQGTEEVSTVAEVVGEAKRGVIVAGPLSDPGAADAVTRLAGHLGWPLVADVGSGARLHQRRPNAIAYADQLLASGDFVSKYVPEVVVHVGGRPTSKRLVQYLARSRPAHYIVVQPHPSRYDPHHHVTHRIEADVGSWCEALLHRTGPPASSSDWLQGWQQAQQAAAQALDHVLGEEADLSEPLVARRITRQIGAHHGLVLGSSMPIRDADMHGVPDGPNVRVIANRGASGIDGLIATAAGTCDGLGQPTTVLLGDLALLHDLNSLALARERPLVIVAINNDGGGIFHFLPIVEQSDVFEPYFGTPHGLTFEGAGTLFGLRYVRAMSAEGFSTSYQDALRRDTGTLIEVSTDRSANRTVHRLLMEAVVTRVEATLS